MRGVFIESFKLQLIAITSRSWYKNYHGHIQFKQVTYFMCPVRYYVADVFNILETLCKLLMFENVNVMNLMTNALLRPYTSYYITYNNKIKSKQGIIKLCNKIQVHEKN